MKITYVYADINQEWNTSQWRCVAPAQALNRSGKHVANLLDNKSFVDNTPEAQGMCQMADVILVERKLFGDTLTAIQRWKARGKLMVADFDDAYNLIHPTNSTYHFWKEGIVRALGPDQKETTRQMNPLPMTQFKWGLQMVHAATMPSKTLAEDWCAYTDTYFQPNYIDPKNYMSAAAPQHEGIIIGWGGSLSHLQSFSDSGVITALQRICASRPNVKVMICGDQRVFDRVKLPENQKLFQGYVPFYEWPRTIANFDIGLAPLHGDYDGRRSWIKILEYMVMKTPWVASHSLSYDDYEAYGKLVDNRPEAWEKALLNIIDHLEEHRARAAGEPYKFGMSQGIDLNVDNIVGVYSTIAKKALGVELN